MDLFGLKLGKKQADPKDQTNSNKPAGKNLQAELQAQARQLLEKILKYRVSIIALVVAGLLTMTALRMLQYMDPPVSEDQVQQNLAQYEKTHINQKVVEKIKQLQASGTSASPNIENGRTNPFAE